MTEVTKQVSKALGTIATVCILIMPHTLGTVYFVPLAVAGNLLLIPQVYLSKQWNLVLLSIVGAGGYIIKFFDIF
jgi:hypothetical protein